MKQNRLQGMIALVSTALLVTLLACEKKSDFLYMVPEAATVSKEHKLKELQGSRDLDILWVIDNSYSMSQFQDIVVQNTDQFIDGLTSASLLHWRCIGGRV